MPDFRRAQKEALRILKEFGVEKPPVDPVRIARDLGVEVVFSDFGRNSQVVVGCGVLDFRGHEWLVPMIVVENFLQIIGMGYIVVRFLYPGGLNAAPSGRSRKRAANIPSTAD